MITVSLIISVAAFLMGRYLDLGKASYPLATLVCFLSSATVFLPMPSWAVVLGMAKHLHPLPLALCAGVGSALGELTGYWIGRGMSRLAKVREEAKRVKALKELMKKDALLWLFLFSLLPNPAFDAAGIAAGLAKVDAWLFFVVVLVGKALRFLLLFYLAGKLA